MRITSALVFSFAIATLGATREASAQCAGFTDVASGGFCASVTWIKNRQITLGCTSATLYCPNDPVSRLAMAAFMNRLGNVMTPLVVDTEETGTSLNLPAGPFYVCQSELVAAVPYPRTAIAHATFTYELPGIQEIFFGVSTSTDGGAFNFGSPLRALNGPGRHQVHYLYTVQPVAAGSTYRYSLRVARTGSLAPSIGAWGCHLQVTVANQFGSQ